MYKQTILTDGDLTVVIQNTLERPVGDTDGEFSVEVWHVIMTSPHYESGIYRRERLTSFDEAYEMSMDQFSEEFANEYTREELVGRIKRFDALPPI